MMQDLILSLLGEPSKLKRIVSLLVRFGFNVICSTYLYSWLINSEFVLDFTDLNSWISFLVSGQAFLCVFLYGLSDVLLYQVLPIVPFSILQYLSRKIGPLQLNRDSQKLVNWYFQFIGFIKIKDSTRRGLKLGENSLLIYKLLKSLEKDRTRLDISNYRSSIASNVFHNYVLFVLVYFHQLATETSLLLDVIVIVGLVILAMVYLTTSVGLEFILEHGNKLRLLYEILKREEDVLIQLSNKLLDFSEILGKEYPYKRTIWWNKRLYILEISTDLDVMEGYTMERYWEITLKSEMPMILIMSNHLSQEAEIVKNEHRNSMNIILFKDKSDLRSNLDNFFDRHK